MRQVFNNIFHPSNEKRAIFFGFLDILIIILSLYLAFLLRFEFALHSDYLHRIYHALPLFIVVKIVVFALFGLYFVTWRFVGISDLLNILNALLVSESLLMMIFSTYNEPVPYMTYLHIHRLPRSVFLIDGLLSLLMAGGLRVSKRIYMEVFRAVPAGKPGKRTIIIGAGNTGESALRLLVKQGLSAFHPVAILDDNVENIGNYIHGIKVYGTVQELPKAVLKYRAEAVIIALPQLEHKLLRRIYDQAKAEKISTIKILPRIHDYCEPRIDLKNLEEISIEDLIGRHVVRIEYDEVRRFIAKQVVLITGAGGSIGSEIAMQVCAFNPRQVVMLDIDETDLYNLEIRMKRVYSHYTFTCNRDAQPPVSEDTAGGAVSVSCVVGDIRDREFINALFDDLRPNIVYHAAAYKHVPIMESNAGEAVNVNMFGTLNLAEAAARYGVNKFILISTDKAVRPTSVMGATKRMAEYICKAYNDTQGTRFVSVRFGNVLGSRGSVLPIFMEQLKRGGPLTVTHKDMERYFMTIPEAVSLVLEASVLGNGGCVMALDMGEAVRGLSLAEELIRIHDLEPYKDVDISFVGMRPGEKLFEEVLTAEEGTTASRHEKVFIAQDRVHYTKDNIEIILEEFRAAIRNARHNGNEQVRGLLKKYVKHYN